MARALFSAGTFRPVGYGEGVVEFPNPTYAKRCEAYRTEVEGVLARVVGVPFTITFEVSPDYVATVAAEIDF